MAKPTTGLEHISTVEPVSVLLEIHRSGKIETILATGRKFLPFNRCWLRQGDKFSFAAIKAIFLALKAHSEVQSVKQICEICEERANCSSYK